MPKGHPLSAIDHSLVQIEAGVARVLQQTQVLLLLAHALHGGHGVSAGCSSGDKGRGDNDQLCYADQHHSDWSLNCGDCAFSVGDFFLPDVGHT